MLNNNSTKRKRNNENITPSSSSSAKGNSGQTNKKKQKQNTKQDDSTVDIMNLFSSPQPTSEEVTREIQKMESLIKTYEEQLEAANNRPLPMVTVDEALKTEPFVPKNKIQAIYYQNIRTSFEADSKLDILLYKDDDRLEKVPKKPQEYDFCEKNEQVFQEILPELTNIVRERLEKVEKKSIESGNLFKKLRYDWWAKNKITIDDVRNENTRFKDQLAKLPPMLNEEEKRNCFVSTNGLTYAEKVLREYQETRILEETWTEEEKKLFIDKFTKTPKDMRVIASYLPNRTTGDVVTFYYNYKLTEDFKKMKNELKLSQKYRKRFVDEGKRKDYNDREPESPMTPSEPMFVKETKSTATENRSSASSRNKKKEEEEVLNEWPQAEITKFKNHFTKFGADFTKIAQKMKTRDEGQCRQFFEDNKVKLKLVAQNTSTKESKKKKTQAVASVVSASITAQPSVASASSTAQISTSPAVKKVAKEIPEKKDAIPSLPPVSTTPTGITKPNKTKKILKIVSIWTVSERDAFLEYFREYGRDWKTIAELIPTKTETQIRNLFLNYKIKLGLTLPTKRRKKKKSPIPYVESNPEVATPDLFTLSVLAGEVQDKGSPLDEVSDNRPQRDLSSSLQVSNNSQLRKTKKSKKGSQSPLSIDVLASVSCNQYIPSLHDLIQSYQTSSQIPSEMYLPPVQQTPSSHFSYPQHQSPPTMVSNIPDELQHKYSRAAPNVPPQQTFKPQPETDRDGIIMRTLVNQGTTHATNYHSISLDSTHHIVNDINLTSNEILTPPYHSFQERLSRLPPMDAPMTAQSMVPSHYTPEPKKNDTTEIVLEEGGFVDYPPHVGFDNQHPGQQHLPPMNNNMSIQHRPLPSEIQQPYMNLPPHSVIQHHSYNPQNNHQ